MTKARRRTEEIVNWTAQASTRADKRLTPPDPLINADKELLSPTRQSPASNNKPGTGPEEPLTCEEETGRARRGIGTALVVAHIAAASVPRPASTQTMAPAERRIHRKAQLPPRRRQISFRAAQLLIGAAGQINR